MTTDDLTHHNVAPWAPLADVVPDQTRRRVAVAHSDRLVRQIEAVDTWIAARRERERMLQAPRLTRDERMDVDRQIEVLRRTHDTIRGRCARGLDAEIGPMRSPGLTAVVAHRHAWFVDKVALLLGERGVTVLACTDDGAEALGVVIAEQPDLLLVGDPLAMMTSRVLLAEAQLFAPDTLRAVQVADQQQGDELRAAADAVFLRHHPPAVVATALVALHLSATADDGTTEPLAVTT